MPKQKKAARGKHRWIGFRVTNNSKRAELNDKLIGCLGSVEWKLFDVIEGQGGTLAIIKIPLVHYKKTIAQINNLNEMETLTSSGKIRLVRERLNSSLGTSPPDSP